MAAALPPADGLLEASARPSHAYLTTADRQRLRITRWHPASRRRDVYRVMADGALVALGHVTVLAPMTAMAYPDIDKAPGWGCESWVAGARLLAARITVSTLQVYTLQVTTETEH